MWNYCVIKEPTHIDSETPWKVVVGIGGKTPMIFINKVPLWLNWTSGGRFTYRRIPVGLTLEPLKIKASLEQPHRMNFWRPWRNLRSGCLWKVFLIVGNTCWHNYCVCKRLMEKNCLKLRMCEELLVKVPRSFQHTAFFLWPLDSSSSKDVLLAGLFTVDQN